MIRCWHSLRLAIVFIRNIEFSFTQTVIVSATHQLEDTRHEVPHRISDDERAGEDDVCEYHAARRGRDPQERRQGRDSAR